MPTSLLSEKELQLVLKAVIATHSVVELDGLLNTCHEFNTFGSLQSNERYFMKDLGYRDFKVHIPYVIHDNNILSAARIQFSRPSKFPAPYLNRNKKLLKELDLILKDLLDGRRKDAGIIGGFKCYHYGEYIGFPEENDQSATGWECSIADEPHSSGQTDPSNTDIRNDFVIIKYERKI